MIILGIETSCDETAVSVVEMTARQNLRLLSNVVLSSMDLHTVYGGVVPEIAARSHIEAIIPVINQALLEAKYGQGFGLDGVQGSGEQRTEPYTTYGEGAAQLVTQQPVKSSLAKAGFARIDKRAADDLWDDIDGIAVTYGAGLGGSLLIGVLTARTLAITKNKPLYAINHVEAHIYANFLTEAQLQGPTLQHTLKPPVTPVQGGTLQSYLLPAQAPEFPMLGLIVSGGHSQLVLWKDHFNYTLLGQTQDDAIGEAFDKVAKILGLPYPGGPSISKKALEGNPFAFDLPKSKMPGKYDFSFSGVKTAVLRLAQAQIDEDYSFPSYKLADRLSDAQKADIAASFQRVAIETIVDKTIQAYEEFKPKSVVIGGGVAANSELRRQLVGRLPVDVQYPDIKLCGDNGAMIAALGCYKAAFMQPAADPCSLDIAPNLSM